MTTPTHSIFAGRLPKRLALLGLATLGTAIRPAAAADDHDDHAGHDHAAHAPAQPATAHADDDHAGHDHGDGTDGAHDHGEEAEALRLTPEQRKRFGIVVQPAAPGSLASEISLPGAIVFNQDRVVHVVPRVAGITSEVRKSVGDTVEAGEVLAVIESRELADAKSECLAARAREALAEKIFAREKTLREKQIAAEQDFLEAEQAWAEARIALRSAEQKLLALGLPRQEVQALDAAQDEALTRYEVRSPLAGIVTEKHVALGESLQADADIFTVADLSSVWVNLTVYAKHLGTVRPGQEVVLRVDHSGAQAHGMIAMITPFVDEATRSATARVVLENRDGAWMPGTFVTGFINLSADDLAVVVARHTVQNINGRDVVFVEHEGAFEMTPVTVGRADRTRLEIVDGLKPGTPVVVEGAFQLKATLITRTLDSHAGHGH